MIVPWKKNFNQPREHIWKQRHYFANKGPIVKVMIFPVVMNKWKRWTLKKTDPQRIDVFELWCWRRFLRVPWTARSNQSILKEINPEYSLERLILKQKLQYFGHQIWRSDSLGKTLMLGKIDGKRRRGQRKGHWHGWLASPTWRTWIWACSRWWWSTGGPGLL